MAFAGILSGARCQLPRARITDKIAAVATESQEHSRPRSKGIYLLPNLLTTGCLFSGFYADVAAFGLAPAIVAYQWGVVRIAEYGHLWKQFGWLACFFYAVAAALRLARFNARAATADKRYFEGLPSPSAAAIVAAFVWYFSAWHEPRLIGLIAAFVVTASAGGLMVSRFGYPS